MYIQTVLGAPQSSPFVSQLRQEYSVTKEYAECAFNAITDAVANTKYAPFWSEQLPVCNSVLADISNGIDNQDIDESYV